MKSGSSAMFRKVPPASTIIGVLTFPSPERIERKNTDATMNGKPQQTMRK